MPDTPPPPTTADLPTLATFWIGPRLPDFQKLCLRSWRSMGHPVRFYAYEPVANLPEGIECLDAEAVFPKAALDDPKRNIPTVIKSDIWRLAMLQKGLGIWCDSDLLLLRPIPRPDRLLLGVEQHGLPCVAVMWWPKDHPALTAMLDAFHRDALGPWAHLKPRWSRFVKRLRGEPTDFSDHPWNHWGRHACAYYVKKYKLEPLLLGYKSFYSEEAYSDTPFRDHPFRHLLDDPQVIGLHCFRKQPEWFENAPPGSLIAWARDRYANA
ncbi:hypothetical protein NOF55_19390 [Rhizobiaceae bacterium BDR2-2]|uniref:Uncharacterized protein n=1 Tax=Ectorhizobium quercum TaxID=2965071 RepID=A0AAE3N1K2_9HYPH|nr:hypothetical protein [Ectorhizobium quercum]MCX8999273.1 hypothetical protein [Ectorhizobium quercum]